MLVRLEVGRREDQLEGVHGLREGGPARHLLRPRREHRSGVSTALHGIGKSTDPVDEHRVR
eukprot:16168902-Heterocapsa_arctica.AAC.1